MIERITPVIPVDDLADAVRQWSGLLGLAPSFVDGDRWAQFDNGGQRLALAGTDRLSDLPGILVKVADLDAACERVASAGLTLGPIQRGPHEIRCLAKGRDGVPVILYAALARS